MAKKSNAKVRKTTKQVKKNNRKARNEALYFIIALLVIIVVGLSVAYAALSATLNITINKVQQNPYTWAVVFKDETVNGVATGTSSTGLSCGDATSSGASVTVADTSLSKPGDKCRWTLTIKNTSSAVPSGTGISAKLNSISATAPTSVTCTGTGNDSLSMECGNITYKLTTDQDGNTLLAKNSTIAAGGQQIVYLHAIYTGTGINTGTDPIVQSGAKFTLVYGQN